MTCGASPFKREERLRLPPSFSDQTITMICDCAPVGDISDAPNTQSDCPPLMADGRVFTDYRGKCAHVMSASSFEARQHYIRNAEEIMNADRKAAIQNSFCAPCFSYDSNGTQLPESTIQTCNKRSCVYTLADSDGLGLGRDTGDSSAAAPTTFSTPTMNMPIYPIDGLSDGRDFVSANDLMWM